MAPPKKHATEMDVPSEINILESKRDTLFEYIQLIYDNAQKAHIDEEHKENFLSSVETVDDIRTEFKSIVNDYNHAQCSYDPSYKPNFKSLISFDDLYGRIKRILKRVEPAPLKVDSDLDQKNLLDHSKMRYKTSFLPKIEIMAFDGDIRNWPLFYASFKSLVHDNSILTDAERLYYLIGKLSSKAQSVFSGIQPNAENYDLILKCLLDRYQDSRALASTYLDQMINLKLSGPASSSKFQLFMDHFVTGANALKGLKLNDLTDFILLHIALKKLDEETVRAFESQYRAENIPTFVQLTDFIRGQYKIYNNSQPLNLEKINIQTSSRGKPRQGHAPSPQSYVAVTAPHRKCLCDNFVHDHLFKCPKFNELTPSARFQSVKEHNACANCCSIRHSSRDCNSILRCKICSQKHHSLLHFNKPNNLTTFIRRDHGPTSAPGIEPARSTLSTATSSGGGDNVIAAQPARTDAPASTRDKNVSSLYASIAAPVRDSSSSDILSAQCTRPTTILLSTAQVVIYDRVGKRHVVKALLDSGSQSNFIKRETCKRLGLVCNSDTQMIVRGFGGSEETVVTDTTDFKIFSRFSNNVNYDVSALVVTRITDKLPAAPVDTSSLERIRALPLADSTFASPTEVELLLGASIFPHLLLTGSVSVGDGLPSAINTVFGHVIMGTVPVMQKELGSTSACCTVVQQSLEHLLKKFWELEEVSATPASSQDDLECEHHFITTTTRDGSGRYTVALPFKDDVHKLGDSLKTAHRRFLCLERKLESSKPLRAAYNDIIREYLDKGYITEIGPIDNISPVSAAASYFVPHHCVHREDKTTTKIRMVLDSSSKTSSGLALNEVLHSGPNLQGDLNSILLNFRLFKIAISADCRQMFLQVGMHESDRKYQRILFRFDPQDPVAVFEFNRVCFGMKSSVFHAVRVVKQLIADEQHKFPTAAAIASSSTYMDDVCFSIKADDSSHNDEAVAVAACTELIAMFKCAQFDLVKWTSNSPAVLRGVPSSHLASVDLEIDRCATPSKILGTHWDRSDDVFKFKVAAPEPGCTKRIILSVVARLWDNLGLVAPVILHAKLLIQGLWLSKCDWDDPPPQRILTLWSQFCSELPALNDVRIPRHLGVVQGCVANLIGFSDASERAYGAVIYLQVAIGGTRTVTLVCSKSKVSPLKTVSVARLELCAAVLLSTLMRKVLDNFEPRYKISNIFAFTDSKVVLCWINSSPHRWQTFVANRVVKIVDNLPASCFHHVAGVDNPADCLSRGVSPATLVNHPLWFSGPPWISKDVAEWPIVSFNREDVDEVPELKQLVHTVTVAAAESLLHTLAHRMSSWSKLLRVVVFVFRFAKSLPRRSSVTRSDLEYSETKILLELQQTHFRDDLVRLKNNQNCSPALQKLKPFLDEHGLIRVGGRLSNAGIDFSHKHPCVLPRHDHVVDMIIDAYHKKYLHAGPELLMSLLRHHYWILAARRVIRHRIHKCNTCFRARPSPSFPMMADLPAFRVNQVDKPFSHTGCDYAGPLQYTPVRGRGVKSRKAWLCIFTCLTTRCLHIEIATDLSTVSFLAALKRFLSRRGPIRSLYSDNATNFVGCRSYLRDLYKFLNEYRPYLEHELAESRIDFKQIPPASPHWGGAWEIMVKLVKSALYKSIGQQILSYEELLTVLAQVEALVNSRPLTALSSDPAEPSALTPAHFLHNAPLSSLPAHYAESSNLLERHLLLDNMVNSFWQSWRVHYLHQLQSRSKWTIPSTPIQLGTVVVIIVDNVPPLAWPLGLVEAVHPSKDGTTRVCTVRTSKGIFVRPVVRLCPLPSQ